MNDENLIPNDRRSPSEVRDNGRKGGINSGIARRQKKAMREWAELIGSLPATVICPDGTTLDGSTLDADTVMQQYRKAHKGDTKAAMFLASLKGEMKQTFEGNFTTVNINTTKEGAKNIEQLMEGD